MIAESPVAVALTLRELPAEEWNKLRALPFARAGLPDPSVARVLVAETPTGEIVGLWAALVAVQLDGLWIAPSHQGTYRLAARLLASMKQLLVAIGVRRAFTYVETDDVLLLALKAGFVRLRADLLVLDTPLASIPPQGESPCP